MSYGYNGLDIKDKVSSRAYDFIKRIGNREYSNYEELKQLVKNVIESDKNSVPYMINSLTDIELRPEERKNLLLNLGHNKRVFDYVSLMCAIRDNGYELLELKDEKNMSIYEANAKKLVGVMITKISLGLDTNIGNPIDFKYIKADSYKRNVEFNSYIDGYALCNIMNNLVQPGVDSNIFKTGSNVKKKTK